MQHLEVSGVYVIRRLKVKRRIKSHLPFASITRRCNYSSR